MTSDSRSLENASRSIWRTRSAESPMLRPGFLAGPLGHVPGGRLDLADPLPNVDRQPDRPPPVGDGPGDGLPDPPRGVRGELESPAPVEQLDGAHQAEIAVLDQVEQRETLALVLPGHRNHQAEVGQDEPLAGLAGLPDLLLGLPDAAGRPQATGPEAILGLLAPLDGHGELDLLLLGEEGLTSCRLQVEADIIRRDRLVAGPQSPGHGTPSPHSFPTRGRKIPSKPSGPHAAGGLGRI